MACTGYFKRFTLHQGQVHFKCKRLVPWQWNDIDTRYRSKLNIGTETKELHPRDLKSGRLMRRFREYEGSKVYFTEGDYAAQSHYEIDKSQIDVKMKLWLLLADHILIGRSHMLNSETTYNWIIENGETISELNTSESVVCGTWGSSLPFDEYVEEMRARALLDREEGRKVEQRATELAQVFTEFVLYEPKTESHLFRDSLVRDLMDDQSPIRRRLPESATHNIMTLAQEISDRDYLRRHDLWNLIDKYLKREGAMLKKYGDIYYYLAGAQYHGGSIPILHPDAAALCRADPTITRDKYERAGDLWDEIVDSWGISYANLRRIPMHEIVNMRNDRLGKGLRRKWKRLLDSQADAEPYDLSVLEFEREKATIILNLFTEKMKEERSKLGTVENWSKAVGAVGVATGVTSFVAHAGVPGIALTSFGVGCSIAGVLKYESFGARFARAGKVIKKKADKHDVSD